MYMRGHIVGKRTMLGFLTQSRGCVGLLGGGYLAWATPIQPDI